MAKAAVITAEVQQTLPTDHQKALHLVSQVKGGIGKSVVSSWLAQYLEHAGRQAACYDADPGNKTFSRVSSLQVRSLDLVVDGEICASVYDSLIEDILEKPGPFVVDTGSSGFVSLWNYVAKNDLFSILAQYGKACVVHVPMAAIPDLKDTLDGFERICALSVDQSVVVWLNQRERRIEQDGQSFLDMEVAKANRSKILGVVANSRQTYSLHREAVGKMLAHSWTFDEGILNLPSMEKIRLAQVRQEVFHQLEEMGL